MSTVITRGSTTVIVLRPPSGLSVSELGEPAVGIIQDTIFLNPEVTVDTTNNCISVTLSEEDTLQLLPGIDVSIQQIWKTGNDEIVRFPIHILTVNDTLLAGFDDIVEPVEPEEPETYEDVTVQVPDPEDEDELEEAERPIIWDEPEEESDVEVDEDFGEYQIFDE